MSYNYDFVPIKNKFSLYCDFTKSPIFISLRDPKTLSYNNRIKVYYQTRQKKKRNHQAEPSFWRPTAVRSFDWRRSWVTWLTNPGSVLVPQGGSGQFTGPETVFVQNTASEKQRGCDSLSVKTGWISLSLSVRTPKCHLSSAVFPVRLGLAWLTRLSPPLLPYDSWALAAAQLTNSQLILLYLASRSELEDAAGSAGF